VNYSDITNDALELAHRSLRSVPLQKLWIVQL